LATPVRFLPPVTRAVWRSRTFRGPAAASGPLFAIFVGVLDGDVQDAVLDDVVLGAVGAELVARTAVASSTVTRVKLASSR
jgi:hypothetical protein